MAGNNVESIVKVEARTGFVDSKNYDSNRPKYQNETVKEVVRMLMQDRSPEAGCKYDILELGAGTGIFTRKLLDALPSDVKVLVSEPMESFLSELRTACPEVTTDQFAAKKMPLENNSVQAVVAAQCFHWFAEKESMDEINRVLKPGGNFVILWNIMDDRDEKGFAWAFYDLTAQWRHGAVQYVDKIWEKQLNDYDGLNEVERKLPTFYIEYTEETFLQFVSTLSFISRLQGEERTKAFDKVRHLLRTHPDTKDQTILKGKKYDEYRQSYQEDSVKVVMRMLLDDISRDQGFLYEVLELGAGTGKFTKPLLERLPPGYRLLVSEPMVDFLSKLYVTCQEAQIKQFAANNIPLPDKSVQATVAVQCFHWFANKVQCFKTWRKCWIVWDNEGQHQMTITDDRGFPKAFFDLLEEWRGDCKQYNKKEWERELMSHRGLYLVERKLLACYRERSEDKFLNYVSTISFISILSEEVKSNALFKVRELIRTHPYTKDRERLKLPYLIDILHCRTTET